MGNIEKPPHPVKNKLFHDVASSYTIRKKESLNTVKEREKGSILFVSFTNPLKPEKGGKNPPKRWFERKWEERKKGMKIQ